MNALVSLDSILEPSVPLSAGLLFGSGQIDAIVSQIEADVRSEVYDVTTEEGRERIKSVAYKVARSKTTLDEIGKEHVAEIKAQSAGIDKERKALRDRLDALKEEIRKPLTDWEDAEKARVVEHEERLIQIIHAPGSVAGMSSREIAERLALVQFICGRDWQEFHERAEEAATEAMGKLNEMFAAAEQRERDAAELEALRAEKAARDEADAKAKAEQDAQAAKARAAEQERIRAERAEEEKAEAVRKAVADAEAKAEREKAAAIESERRRQEQEARDATAKKAAEEAAERKRQENKRHRAKINGEICADLIAAGVPNDVELVQSIVKAIVSGSIRHVSVQY